MLLLRFPRARFPHTRPTMGVHMVGCSFLIATLDCGAEIGSALLAYKYYLTGSSNIPPPYPQLLLLLLIAFGALSLFFKCSKLLSFPWSPRYLSSANQDVRKRRIWGHRPRRLFPTRSVEGFAVNHDVPVVCSTEQIHCRKALPHRRFPIRRPSLRTASAKFAAPFGGGLHCSLCTTHIGWRSIYQFS